MLKTGSPIRNTVISYMRRKFILTIPSAPGLPVSLPLPGIMEKTAVTVRAIIPILMPIGDVTAILELTILDIRCICCLTMTASLELTFLYISVSGMQNATTVSAGLLRLRNSVA